MRADSIARSQAAGMSGAQACFQCSPTALPDTQQGVSVGRLVARCALLLLGVLAGCAVRAPHRDMTESQGSPSERTVKGAISAWETALARFINQEGGGDPAVLSQTRALHSRDVLRPARITFDVLDVDAQVPSRDGWDVEGVLIGKHSSGTRNWYVFLVGIVARGGYRAASIQDIRMVGLATQEGELTWAIGANDRGAVERYRDTFRDYPMVRFPADTDRFVMNVSGDRASVQELGSGADWSLQLTNGTLERGATKTQTGALIHAGAR